MRESVDCGDEGAVEEEVVAAGCSTVDGARDVSGCSEPKRGDLSYEIRTTNDKTKSA